MHGTGLYLRLPFLSASIRLAVATLQGVIRADQSHGTNLRNSNGGVSYPALVP